jgi:hypothetical protein
MKDGRAFRACVAASVQGIGHVLSACLQAGAPTGPWEGRGAFLYHVDFVFDVVCHIVALAHYAHIWWLHGLALQLVDAILFLDMRWALLCSVLSCQQVLLSICSVRVSCCPFARVAIKDASSKACRV